MKKTKLTWLYPDMLDLHGDRGNVFAFERVAKYIGVQLDVERVNTYSDPIDFAGSDIILVSPGETVVCAKVAQVLKEKREDIIDFINNRGVLVVIGNSLSIFAKETERSKEEGFEGLGIINCKCTELRTAYSNDAVFTTEAFGEKMEIVGGQIQMLKFELGDDETPLGSTVYGYGNARDGKEGVIKKGFIHTNLLGPVMVKNPWFASAIIRRAAGNDGLTEDPFFDLEERTRETKSARQKCSREPSPKGRGA